MDVDREGCAGSGEIIETGCNVAAGARWSHYKCPWAFQWLGLKPSVQVLASQHHRLGLGGPGRERGDNKQNEEEAGTAASEALSIWKSRKYQFGVQGGEKRIGRARVASLIVGKGQRRQEALRVSLLRNRSVQKELLYVHHNVKS